MSGKERSTAHPAQLLCQLGIGGVARAQKWIVATSDPKAVHVTVVPIQRHRFPVNMVLKCCRCDSVLVGFMPFKCTAHAHKQQLASFRLKF